MKKVWMILLVWLLLCGCAAQGVESCPAAEPAPTQPVAEEPAPKAPETEPESEPEPEPIMEEVNITQTEPCSLQIANGSRIGDVLGGTCSWWYDNADGTRTGIEACGLHPLEAAEHMPVLVMDGTQAQLLFSPVEPDRVTVRGWSVSCWGDPEAEAEEIPVDGMEFALRDEGFVYEVAAVWDRFETWGGTAYYTFCAAPLGVELHAEAVTDKGMTLVCSRNGGSDRNLQTGQRYWLQQRNEAGYWEDVYTPEAWEDLAYAIPADGTVSWDLNWERGAGSLPDGIYRVGKEILDFRGSGEYDAYRIWSDNFAIRWVEAG